MTRRFCSDEDIETTLHWLEAVAWPILKWTWIVLFFAALTGFVLFEEVGRRYTYYLEDGRTVTSTTRNIETLQGYKVVDPATFERERTLMPPPPL